MKNIQFIAASLLTGIYLAMPVPEAGAFPVASNRHKSAPLIYLYDMGSSNSPLWAGFTRVTPDTTYTPERGYGWTSSRPKAEVRACLDALACDYISYEQYGPHEDLLLEFRQDLPNGEYEVWVLTGSFLSLKYLLRPHTLQIQGRNAIEIQPREADIFRAVQYEWSKGDDIYDHFVAPRFAWLRHQASVADGKLRIGFTNAKYFPVGAIVIAGKNMAERMDEALRKIDRNRKAEFNGIWAMAPVEPGNYEPDASEQERKRGYIVSVVHYLDELRPGSAPPAGASRSKIEIFATPGEQEQASFAVYSLKDLREVAFEVSELRANNGRTIPASVINRGLVAFAPCCRLLKKESAKYDISHGMILPARPTFIGKDTCKQFWLTVTLPADAAAGVYEGEIRISASASDATTLKLQLRVLPFKLAIPPVERFFYFGSMRYEAMYLMEPYDENKFWESVRAETRYLKENEFSIAICDVPWTLSAVLQSRMGLPSPTNKWYWIKKNEKGEVVDLDLAPTSKLMEIVKEENGRPRDNLMVCLFPIGVFGAVFRQGFDGEKKELKFLEGENLANFIRAVRIVNAKARQAGWPELVFESGGEYGGFGGDLADAAAKYAIALHSTYKEAGVRNALRGNGLADMAAIAKGLVDYPEPAWPLFSEQWLPVIKTNAKRGLWVYNSSRGRFGYGWFCFKHGITRASWEGGIYFQGQPGNIFDDKNRDYPVGGLPASLTSFVPSIYLKRMVEGADDLKYLSTLDGLIKQAGPSGKPAAQATARAAKAWLDERLETIPEYTDKKLSGDIAWYNEVDNIVDWSSGDYDKYRWQMAEFIITLKKELGE